MLILCLLIRFSDEKINPFARSARHYSVNYFACFSHFLAMDSIHKEVNKSKPFKKKN